MVKRLFFIPFFMVKLSAIVYEDAEDFNAKRWTSVSPNHPGRITNIFDKEKASRIIEFKGEGTKSIYRLSLPTMLENIQLDNSFLSWEMNYAEDFVILIVLDTLKGKRHLIYTPDEKNSYLQYGLGKIEQGKWKKYRRNLEKDLQLYEKENRIIAIKDFIIKGSGKIDNILLNTLKERVALPVVKKLEENKTRVVKHDYSNDIMPVLKLKGKNPLVLKVGEAYVEAGASAKNRDGSEIDIKITDNIDILKEGEYTVIYFATNKLGNTSIDKRRVIVGKIRNKKVECRVVNNCDDDLNVLEEKSNDREDYPRNKEELLQIVAPLIDNLPQDKDADKKKKMEEKASSEHRFPKNNYKDDKLMKEKFLDKKEEFKDKKDDEDDKLLKEKYPDKKEDNK